MLSQVLFALEISQPLQDAESGMSKKDEELARLRGKLEKRWGNDNDSSYAYLDPITGQRYPLTPFMMDEWVRGMVCSVYYEPGCVLMTLYSTMGEPPWRFRLPQHVLTLQTVSVLSFQLTSETKALLHQCRLPQALLILHMSLQY
jgi:hypothetical protein